MKRKLIFWINILLLCSCGHSVSNYHESAESAVCDSVIVESPIMQETAVDETDFDTYETERYSMAYPKEWIVVKHPDELTDVALSAPDESLACVILYMETDYSLSDIIQITNSEFLANAPNAGCENVKVVKNEKIQINGVKGYRRIFEFKVLGMSCWQVGYTFMKNGIVYDLKFGNDKEEIAKKADLIDRMIKSFKMK